MLVRKYRSIVISYTYNTGLTLPWFDVYVLCIRQLVGDGGGGGGERKRNLLFWSSRYSIYIYIYICVHCSLVYQFEHSGKVRRAWFKFGFENFYSSLLSGSASFHCAAMMNPQRMKQYCPQIEYIYIMSLT